jgi:hypothetical protein
VKVIWKYNIDLADTQVLRTKAGAKFLDVQIQNHYPTIWVEVDTEAAPKDYVIEVFGTGNPMTLFYRKHIGTIQDGGFVWHVYVRES